MRPYELIRRKAASARNFTARYLDELRELVDDAKCELDETDRHDALVALSCFEEAETALSAAEDNLRLVVMRAGLVPLDTP